MQTRLPELAKDISNTPGLVCGFEQAQTVCNAEEMPTGEALYPPEAGDVELNLSTNPCNFKGQC